MNKVQDEQLVMKETDNVDNTLWSKYVIYSNNENDGPKGIIVNVHSNICTHQGSQ